MDRIVNYKLVFNIISRNLLILSGSLLLCIPVSIVYSEAALPFILTSIISLASGLILFLFTKIQSDEIIIRTKEAYLIVTLSWLIIALIGCLPYLLSGSISVFVDAFFESISGFTTTGSSILSDIEGLPMSMLFWRSLTHWIGGIGIIVLFIILMPHLHIGGYSLFTLESSLQEKIKPRIKSVGIRLLIIYTILTVIEIGLLLSGGMNLFESICHSFGTIATGGFSPKNSSISDYSNYIQYIIMVFMLLGGTNFVIHYYLLTRNFRKIKTNQELKFYLSVVFVLGVIISFMLYFMMNLPLERAFREGFFQVISIVTCTGYSTADYLQWPEIAWIILFFAMFLGGSTGSTAGGIKMARHLIILKNIQLAFRRLISPNAIFTLNFNRNLLHNDTNRSILTFVSVYFLTFIAGSILLVLIGTDGRTAFGSAATCMAGIGPGIGSVGPASNFAHLSGIAKIILSFLMLIGRLEIYTVVILFTKNFWRN